MIAKTFIAAAALGSFIGMVAAPGGTVAHEAEGGYGDTVKRDAELRPVPTNRVDGKGFAKVKLTGNTARVLVTVQGLLEAPHAMHFHINGKGRCPTAKLAVEINGKRTMTTTAGLPAYGSIGTSLTTEGDTTPASGLAVDRFPQTGTFTYERTFEVSDDSADNIRAGTAVVVVHGIDYNNNGTYDDVLGASELDPALPQEATAPALCGPLTD